MSVLNPIELFAQTIQMLANADCPQCGRKDGSALSPGRKDSGACEWCDGRHQVLDQAKHWLQRSGVTASKDRPRPRAVAQQAAGQSVL
jgi:predicted methyltransferase